MNKFLWGKRINCVLIGFLAILAWPVAADVYQPNLYLTRDLPETIGESALEMEVNYFKNVVGNVYGSLNPELITKPGDLSLGEWKRYNGFNSRITKTLQEYYYNSADLGLARDMTCVRQWQNDEQPIAINELTKEERSLKQRLASRGDRPMSCYVSNRGDLCGEKYFGILGIVGHEDPFATVAMEYWPGLDGGPNTVRFFVFGEAENPDDGRLVAPKADAQGQLQASTIKLDSGAGHSQPGICLSCHGGSVNSRDGTVTGARFLPFDIAAMEFPDRWWVNFFPNILSPRSDAIDRFDEMNSWIYQAETSRSTEANASVTEFLGATYGAQNLADINRQGSELNFDTKAVPSSFSNREDLYHNFYRPFCQSCHISSSVRFTDQSFDQLGFAYMCNESTANRVMPHAEVNERNMLRHADFLKHHVLNSTGSECDDILTLVDFPTNQIDGPSLTHVRSAPEQEAYAGSSALADSDFNGKIDRDENYTNNTLQVAYRKKSAKIRIEESDFSFQGVNRSQTRLEKLSFKHFIERPGARISVYFYRESGATAVINLQGGGSNFTIESFSQGDGRMPNNTYAATIVLVKEEAESNEVLELDDILYRFDNRLLAKAKVYDFEDASEPAELGIQGIRQLSGDAASYLTEQANECRGNRANSSDNELRAWQISGDGKVLQRPGHSSFVTSPFICAGDLATFTWQLEGQTDKKASISFDWKNARDEATLYLYAYTEKNGYQFTPLAQLADANHYGHLKVDVDADSQLIFVYAYRTPSSQQSTSDFDDFGAAIDNMRVVYH